MPLHHPVDLSDKRVQLSTAGQVELKLKTPWREGTTHLMMSLLARMQRGIGAATTLSPDGATRQRPVVSVS